MKNSVDPDQLASLEASWSGPTLFFREYRMLESYVQSMLIRSNSKIRRDFFFCVLKGRNFVPIPNCKWAGWSVALLVAHTTLLESSCRGSFITVVSMVAWKTVWTWSAGLCSVRSQLIRVYTVLKIRYIWMQQGKNLASVLSTLQLACAVLFCCEQVFEGSYLCN